MNIILHLEFIIKIFILGVIPWIFLSKENSLYFKTKNLKLAVIFNCFASLFASSIYMCLYYSKTLGWWHYTSYIYIAIFLAIVYFILLFLYYEELEEESKKDTFFELKRFDTIKEKSDEQNEIYAKLKSKQSTFRTIVIIHFILYLLIFSLLAFGLGLNRIA